MSDVVKSPDLSKMIGVIVDERTTIYFKIGTPVEQIKKKVELYKKALEKSTNNIVVTHDENL
jgi:molybdopterin synthase catalytic subunit